VWIG
jgi:hypothetical protein